MFLGDNFWTRNPSKSSKVSKDSDFSLVSNKKTWAKYYHLAIGAQGQMKWVKKYFTYDVTHKKSKTQNQKTLNSSLAQLPGELCRW